MAWICLSATGASGALVQLKSTPYDRQLAPVRHVLDHAGGDTKKILDVETLNRKLGKIYWFTYRSQKAWTSPEEVLETRIADCKGRAIVLHHQLNQSGTGRHYLVIGQLNRNSGETHTWIVYQSSDREYILDPTFHSRAIPMEKVRDHRYVPQFIFASGNKFGYVPNHLLLTDLDIADLGPETRRRFRLDVTPLMAN